MPELVLQALPGAVQADGDGHARDTQQTRDVAIGLAFEVAEGEDLGRPRRQRGQGPAQPVADLPGLVIRRPWENGLAIDAAAFDGREVAHKAVLVHTGWDRHWRTEAYFGEHPYLTAEAADWLVDRGAAIVGIDSVNIDNMHVRARPVHTRLLGAGIPICEHMSGLGGLPDEGFRFSAVPPKVKGMGTFPVRAYAVLG